MMPPIRKHILTLSKIAGSKPEPVKLFFSLYGYQSVNRPLKNYLRCRYGVKNRLKMLIYYA